jgi:ankyrin repeat protein
MIAAQAGKLESCRALIHAGADVKARDVEGQTALSLAQAGKHTAVVRLLKKSAPE